MKGRIKMPLVDWLKVIIISFAVVFSVALFMYGCNLALVKCYHRVTLSQ
jgi:hypothetical protein